jgi:multidrug efflux pump subunit AcrA (membrane-fusion protein)
LEQNKIKSMNNFYIYSLIAALTVVSCNNGKEKAGEKSSEGRVPVIITNPVIKAMTVTVELNATSTFLLKTFVKSNINGYMQQVNVQIGENIKKGSKMFVLKSKESQNIGNTIMSVDSSLHFSGLVTIQSPGNGYITQLNYREGDYIQDGETLAAISDVNSLVFMLELPYELKQFLSYNKTLEVVLPDGQNLIGTIESSMPSVDAVSQTQSFIIRIQNQPLIPENLIATVKFVKKTKQKAISIPKDAVLTNEVQSEFWIMKMIDSITAVKIKIEKGIETSGQVEVVSPILSLSDKILLKGNYGLPDTAKVFVENKE